jgi:hypothetical protein
MASVRLTNELRETIFRHASAAFKAARPYPQASSWLADRLRDGIHASEQQALLKECYVKGQQNQFRSYGGYPSNVKLTEVSNITINTYSDWGTTHTNTNNKAASSLAVEFVPSIKLFSIERWGSPEVIFEELPKQTQTDLGPQFKQLSDSQTENLTAERDYSSKIRNLLNECTTVKQLLLAWPACESFVPYEFKNRMYEKVTRIQRAQEIKEQVQFDDQLVNEVVLTAKLVGG